MKKIEIVILCFLGLQLFSQVQIPNTIRSQEKIWELSMIWREASYNFPYFEYLKTNQDSIYKYYVKKIIETKNDYEYYLTLREYIATFKDGHTYVYFPDSLIRECITRSCFNNFKLSFTNIENKIVVSGTSQKTQGIIPLGSIILEVDSLPVYEYLKKRIFPYFSSSSPQKQLKIGTRNILMGIKGTNTFIKYKTPAGTIKSLQLTRGKCDNHWVYKMGRKPFYKHIDSTNISILTINSFSNKSIVDSLNKYLIQLKKSNGVILDIRKNTGGSSLIGKEIAGFFLSDSIIIGSNVKTRVNKTFLRTIGARLNTSDTVGNGFLADCYKCYHNILLEDLGNAQFDNSVNQNNKLLFPIIVLIGADNISAAEEFLIYLSNQKHIILIGENTGGGNGQPTIISLPSGGIVGICSQYCSYVDGNEYYRIGIKPDINVKQKYSDFLNGIDTQMEFAIGYIMNQEIDNKNSSCNK